MAPTPSSRIAGEIRRRITSGELRAGDRVPSTREITREWGVAIATASRVLAILQQEGWVRPVRGVGTVVEASPDRTGVARSRGAEPVKPPPRDDHRVRESLVDAGVRIADGEGLAALSMRRVAAALGIPTMSLYRYVPSKDELVLLMADRVMGELALPEPPPKGWRAQLELLARLQWQGYKRHPWLPAVISMTRPQILPNGVRQTEWALRAVHGLGLDETSSLHVAVTLISFVRGTAINLESEIEAEQETGLDAESWMSSQKAAFAEAMRAGPYPHLARMVMQSEIDLDLDSLFEFGLARFLDGLAELIGRAGCINQL